MTPEQLENALRSFVRRTPFQPFVIERQDDQPVVVRNPESLAFGSGGGASYFDDGDICLIDCEQVIAVRALSEVDETVPSEPGGSAESRAQFDRDLRTLLTQRPFRPFVVELTEGESFIVEEPEALAFCNGAAAYIGPGLVRFFNCETVKSIHLAAEQAAS